MEYLTSIAELRAHYLTAGGNAVRKELGRLDGHCRSFIGRSPFVLIGSSDRDGNADVTPKGDKPGFVAVLDDATIAIPDRPGNNRLDTWENIVVNPAVGLLFLIPGMDETLRVNGEGRITADAALRERLAVDGKVPATVLVVSVRACYMHCAKAFMRWARSCATSSRWPRRLANSTARWTRATPNRCGRRSADPLDPSAVKIAARKMARLASRPRGQDQRGTIVGPAQRLHAQMRQRHGRICAPAGVLEHGENVIAARLRHVLPHDRMEQHAGCAAAPASEPATDEVDGIGPFHGDRMSLGDRQRGVEPFHPVMLVGPEIGAQAQACLPVGDVDRCDVASGTPHDLEPAVEWRHGADVGREPDA
jgi:uncharacterized protein